MDLDIVSGKDTKFTEAVALSLHGADVANWQLFHKVVPGLTIFLYFSCHVVTGS